MFRSFSFFAMIVENNFMGMGGWEGGGSKFN